MPTVTEDDYQFNLNEVRKTIAVTATKYPLLSGLVYTSPYDFLYQHGRDYRPIPWAGRYKIGVQKQCFGNAIFLAARFGLKYVEGIALAPTGEAILHGWNTLPDGELVDSTWGNTGLVYLGVEFSVERADDATWNGDAHVLNDENRGYPIFQQRWQGEDYARSWPYSDRLECLWKHKTTGKKDYTPPPSVKAWLEGEGS